MKKIDVIALEVSTKCGADCIMCPHRDLDYPYEDMPLDLFKLGVDEAVRAGASLINMVGLGDPCLSLYFEEECKYVKENYPDVKISMSNTCHMIKGKMLDVVCKYFDDIQVSMYGMTKETYEKIHRGSLVFEEIKENIDNLLRRDDRPYVRLNFVDMPENHDEYDTWKAYYEGKADQINVWKLKYWNGYVKADYKDRPFVECMRVNTLNGLYINTDGSISACCNDYKRAVIIGNIKENSLQEILDGEETRKLQKMNKDGSIRNREFCKDCEFIHDRSDALLYSSNASMRTGMHSAMPGIEKIFD